MIQVLNQYTFLSADELSIHIRGCALNVRESQKKIYTSFYGYAKDICDRYVNNQEDSVEILNDGFLNFFKEAHRYKSVYVTEISSFRDYLKKIMVCTAIDHIRKSRKHQLFGEIDSTIYYLSADNKVVFDKVSYHEIIKSMQELSPG